MYENITKNIFTISMVAVFIIILYYYTMDVKQNKIHLFGARPNMDIKTHEIDEYDKEFTAVELEELKIMANTIGRRKNIPVNSMHDRWIVVTSIFHPTKDIKSLASIPGWKLVVVADKKTPKDWSYKDVVFLDVDTQLNNLDYETIKYLKFNVYTRKNIGYLYAIQHGAKVIYDTDDDNVPYNKTITFDDMSMRKPYLVYKGNRTFYNVFAHFGQSTMWPRGYPLNKIADTPVRTYRSCSNIRPLVQQGVVDGDPDLDAIGRLTRKDSSVKFDLRFDRNQKPVALPHRSFAPYNSQNTFHLYDAFWGLFLPESATFRVTDIWRSYITQRLLWDVGGHLTYNGPNAYQNRNGHDYQSDYVEEHALYTQCISLTNCLLRFKGQGTSILDRYFEIFKELYRQKFLKARDVRIARAWVRDILRFGYVEPKIIKSKLRCSKKIFHILPNEQPSSFLTTGLKYVIVNKIEKLKTVLRK